MSWSDETYHIYGASREDFEVTPESYRLLVRPDDHERLVRYVKTLTGIFSNEENLMPKPVYPDLIVKKVRQALDGK
jgi:hypothetical protein